MITFKNDAKSINTKTPVSAKNEVAYSGKAKNYYLINRATFARSRCLTVQLPSFGLVGRVVAIIAVVVWLFFLLDTKNALVDHII